MINLILRGLFWLHIRGVERELHDVSNAMRADDLPIATFNLLMQRRRVLREELSQARGRYDSTFPPGVRHTWGSA